MLGNQQKYVFILGKQNKTDRKYDFEDQVWLISSLIVLGLSSVAAHFDSPVMFVWAAHTLYYNVTCFTYDNFYVHSCLIIVPIDIKILNPTIQKHPLYYVMCSIWDS